MVIATMLLSMGAVYAQEGLEQEECWYDRVCMFGYFQFRYEDVDNGNDEFDFRRMYLTLKGDVDERTTGIITLSRVGPDDPNVDLYNAFVDYKLSDRYAIQAGQVPTWFGLEAWEGSSVRLPFERAKIFQAGPGFYFAGASDRGVWVRRTPEEQQEPLVVLGVWNGQFREGDANDDKNISLDVKFDREWGQFGASWFDGSYVDVDGTFGPAGAETDRNGWDVYLRKFAEPWGVQAEYSDGELLGSDIDGWYAQGMYDFQDDKNVGFARYQEFNSENGANWREFDAITVGVRHRVYDSGFITLQYTDGDWENDAGTGASEDLLGIQWQYNYR
jgi:hypothetical protein